jgi:transcriptional regulator with XRE-family HTH domain
MTEKTIHEGRNVKRIREILGIKQDALAMELGLSQQAVSALEQKEALDKEVIEKIAKVLKVSSDAIKSFNEETAVNFFNTFNDSTVNHGAFAAYNFNCTFNPLDKVIELYDALLKSEREKIALLEKMLDKK